MRSSVDLQLAGSAPPLTAYPPHAAALGHTPPPWMAGAPAAASLPSAPRAAPVAARPASWPAVFQVPVFAWQTTTVLQPMPMHAIGTPGGGAQ